MLIAGAAPRLPYTSLDAAITASAFAQSALQILRMARKQKLITPQVTSKRFRWASVEGRVRALDMLAAERFANYNVSVMTPEWWAENVKDCYSKLLATCRVCERVCRTSAITDLQQGQSFGCCCNGGVPWAGEAGRAQALKMLAAERFANYDVSAMTPEWWAENVKDCYSKLLATCRVCERVCRTSAITDLQQGQSFECLCRNKTERKLHAWLRQEYSTVAFQVPGCINPATGRTLRFDFGLQFPRRLVFVELDGRIGHFGRDFRGEESLDHVKRDFFKESWALAKHHSVVRVLQEDVWFDLGDWPEYLRTSILRAQESPRVCCPPASEYLQGVYASLRSALSSGATSL